MKRDLWLRLRDYHFDDLVPPNLWSHVSHMFGGPDASTRAFADKLGRKLGWSTGFSLRAIGEYKKFVYLGIVSDFPVTPPKLIDQVWHEHLLFSRAYREFCGNVLRRDFDHNPELVPTDDQTGTFQTQYLATLDLYESEFGYEPPADIWATPKFKGDLLKTERSARKKKQITDSRSVQRDDTPLFLLFDGSSDSGGHSYHAMPEFAGFGGGGGFSGGGGGASWGGGDHSSDSTSAGGGDSGSSDGGSGGDGGGSSCGGSGCSSGCGGGGE